MFSYHLPRPLTAREAEVASLIAHGCTNREIGATLVIAERTAESHVSNICAKLGFRSRTQVAVWAAQHGLTGGESPATVLDV
jgi:non-specific serine/threonine protein kinase